MFPVPEQEKPSPLKPSLQAQRYEPGVLTHSALGLQLWSSVEHSSKSTHTNTHTDTTGLALTEKLETKGSS